MSASTEFTDPTSPDISGDESIPYENWKKYAEAVKEGVEIIPEKIVIDPVAEYEFNVDEALDTIDLNFGGYKPSIEALEFFSLIRAVMGEDPEVDSSLMHYFLVDLVFGNIKRNQYPYSVEIQERIRINNRKIAIIAARGSAKSTVITAFLPIYLAVTGKMPNFGNVMFVVGFGDSQQAGAKVQANTIRDICEESAFCKDYFEKMRFTDEECEFIRKGDGKIKSRAFMYKVKGAAGGSVRGIRYKTERPHMIIFDDIIKNEADASSPIIMDKLKSMIYSDAENALGGKRGKVIIINTPFNKNDPVYQALESGTWTPVCLPICEQIYDGMPKDKYVGAWEAMHEYERVMERFSDARGTGTMRGFMQELMLRISSEEDRMIQEGMIEWYTRENLMDKLSSFNIYITTDFTTTSESKSDFSALTVWAVGPNKDYYMLDLCVKRQGIQAQYDELFRMVEFWRGDNRHIEVGVEVDGQQRAHIFALKELMEKKGTWFSFCRQKGAPHGKEGILSRSAGGNKHERFRMLLPAIQNHKFHFPRELENTPDMREAKMQLQYVTYSGFGAKDDFLDTMSQLGLMNIHYPRIVAGHNTELNSVKRKARTGIFARVAEDKERSPYDSYV